MTAPILVRVLALLSLATPLTAIATTIAGNLSNGVDADQWMALERQIAEQVDVERTAGADAHAVVAGGNLGHGLARTAVLSGIYDGLPAQNSSPGPEFGHSVALDGDWLAVGAPGTLVDGGAIFGGIKPGGSVFLFRRANGWQFSQRITVIPHGDAPRCGHSVALKLPHLVLGCPGGRSGSHPTNEEGITRYYRLDDNDTWTMTSHGSTHADSFGDSRCGTSVAVSTTGATSGIAISAVGCPGWDGARGRVLTRSFNPTSGAWSTTTQVMAEDDVAGDRFGEAIAIARSEVLGISASRLAVGAPNKAHGAASFAGSAYVFEGSPWTQVALFTGPSPNLFPSTYFGSALAVTLSQLVIGARGGLTLDCGNPPRCGTVRRYERIAGAWQAQEGGGAINAGGNPPGEQAGMQFGNAVAIGFDNWVAVAAPRANGWTQSNGLAEEVGMVELRRDDGGGWGVSWDDHQGEVRPAQIGTLAHSHGHFGTSLAFGGRRLAVGYPRAGVLLTGRRGQVWIYEEDRIFADDFED